MVRHNPDYSRSAQRDMKISIAENFRAVFYAPFYALQLLGFAAREGLEIAWVPGTNPGGALDEVKRGRIDTAFGGPMRVLKDRDGKPASGDSLVSFGEVVGRDPFFLVGRGLSDSSSFELKSLAEMRVGIVSEVPTPWHCLRADLVEAGMDIVTMYRAGRFVNGLTMAQQLEELKAGKLDAAQLFEPYVSQLLAEGSGHILYAASERGPTVYTTFICSHDSVSRRRGEFTALTRALQATLDWVAEKGPAELARVVAPLFPDLPKALLETAMERYHRAGLWSRGTEISRAGFDRLAYSLREGGFIGTAAAYADCVHDFGSRG
jgi:NitT/TauT family transport system substrate-binding protein